MRTTLTLDPDVVAAIGRLRQTRKGAFKELVNQALREGLKQLESPKKRKKPFRTTPVDLGPPLFENLTNVEEVLSLLKGKFLR